MDDHLEANRLNWDERTAVHLGSRFYDVDGRLRDGRGPRPHETEALGTVTGLTLLHLQCHFGLDTGSILPGAPMDHACRCSAAASELQHPRRETRRRVGSGGAVW